MKCVTLPEPWPVTSSRWNQIYHALKLLWYVINNWGSIQWWDWERLGVADNGNTAFEFKVKVLVIDEPRHESRREEG